MRQLGAAPDGPTHMSKLTMLGINNLETTQRTKRPEIKMASPRAGGPIALSLLRWHGGPPACVLADLPSKILEFLSFQMHQITKDVILVRFLLVEMASMWLQAVDA